MAGKWREAVWAAIQRRARHGMITRNEIIVNELDEIVKVVGSVGRTPEQTLSRELQDLRDAGVLIFDGAGHYRIASGLTGMDAETAIATEAWRYQKSRVGQSAFRQALVRYWEGRCPLTGITELELLRASHIVPWNRCETEGDRLDLNNGLLLSPLWDAVFDRGLVTFTDSGKPVASHSLSNSTLEHLGFAYSPCIDGLSAGQIKNLEWHRKHCFRPL